MKMFDKIKDLFTDEVEVETEVDEPVKKEMIKVEIPAPQKNRVDDEEITKEMPKVDSVSPFFDELDFEDIKRSNITLDDVYQEREVPEYKEERKEIYSSKKPEPKKHFEPTPIISPVYGVLDKNYKKDDIVDKAEPIRAHKDITIDDVRNKAYGTLEDELENTLFGKTAILFQEDIPKEEKDEEYKNIEDELDKTAVAIDLLKEDKTEKEVTEEPRHKKKNIKEQIEDIPLEDTMISEVLKNDLEKDEKISESELFNLIDDIYGEDDK